MLLATLAAVVAMDPVQKKEDIGSRESLLVAMNYVMASPRAFLMNVPMEGTTEWAMIGALENFPRADGNVEIPVGTRAIFSLSPEREGAWHEGTYGTIETLPTAQRFEGAASCECDAYATEGLRDGPVPARNVKTETGGFGEVAPCPWITIAIDGARHTRAGRILAPTKVETPVELAQRGFCCVRGTVSPSVQSSSPRPTEPSTRQDAIYTKPMPAITDTKALSPDEDDWKNSGAGRFSPGVFVATRDRHRAIPL
jgi:hypothetical protein